MNITTIKNHTKHNVAKKIKKNATPDHKSGPKSLIRAAETQELQEKQQVVVHSINDKNIDYKVCMSKGLP